MGKIVKTVNRRTMLADGSYKVIKYLVLVFIPAISTFYFALGNVWGFPDVTKVVGSLAALATFLGLCIHMSSSAYYGSDAQHDGTISVTPNDTGGSTLRMNVDPTDVVNKDAVSLKVVTQPPVPPVVSS